MRLQDFLERVASEPARTVMRTVWTTPAEVLAKAARPGGLSVAELLGVRGRRSEQREVTYKHILGPPASTAAIDAWEKSNPSRPLPADLRALIAQVNGIHLWANLETGRSYTGLSPIEEWETARLKMYGRTADPDLLDDRYLALSYHSDNASFVVLDVTTGKYFLMDTAGPDTTTLIARTADELLDWIWKTRIEPRA